MGYCYVILIVNYHLNCASMGCKSRLSTRGGAAWMTTKISTLPNLPAVVVLNDYESNPTLLADRYWLFLIGKC